MMISESEDEREQQEVDNLINSTSSGLNMMMINQQTVPRIGYLKVSKLARLHIGDEYINQSIYNTRTVNGNLGPKPLLLAKPCARRFKIIGIASTAMILSGFLIFMLFYITPEKEQGRLDIGLNETWYKPRPDWQAMKEYRFEYLQLPVKYVLIEHAGESYCAEVYTCVKEVINIQREHFRRGWSDIGPNYLIGGNGLVFEGRGANILGTMVKTYDHKCISVMFLGHYERDPIVKEQFDHLGILVKQLVKLKVLDPHYTIIAHCQFDDWTISPGRHVIEGLRKFTHWGNVTHWDNFNESLCLRSESELAK